MVLVENSVTKNKRGKLLKHLGNVCIAVVWLSLMTSSMAAAVDASESANQVIGSEGGTKATKAAIGAALKVAKSKPAMAAATGIVCLACIPLAGVAASPAICIACSILIAKTFG